jgi:hypothetical protein
MGIECGKSFSSHLTAVLAAAAVLGAGNARAQEVPIGKPAVPTVPEGVPEIPPVCPEEGNDEVPGAVGGVIFDPDAEREDVQLWGDCLDAHLDQKFEIDALLREVTSDARRALNPYKFDPDASKSGSLTRVLDCKKGSAGKAGSSSVEEIAACVVSEADNNPRSGFHNDTSYSLLSRVFSRPQDPRDLRKATGYCIDAISERGGARATLFLMRDIFRAHVDSTLEVNRGRFSNLRDRFDAQGKGAGKKGKGKK